MPLFQSKRRRKPSPPAPDASVPTRSTNGANLHRRTPHRPILPVTNADSFLNGGMMHVKRRKRRVHRPHRSSLFWRVWWNAPFLVIACSLATTYSVGMYLLVPMVSLKLHERRSNRLLHDVTLHLDPIKKLRRRMDLLSNMRTRIRREEIGSRLELLEAIVPDFLHGRDESADTSATTTTEQKQAPPKAEPNDQQQHDEQPPAHLTGSDKAKSDQKPSDNHNPTPTIRTLQNMDELPNSSKCPETIDSLSTTLVMQATLDRLWILHETCRRWKDPIVVVVAVSQTKNETIPPASDFCPQLQLLAYNDTSTDRDAYPVNVLRNVGLDQVRTSHVLMLDVDFVPSDNLDGTLKQYLASETTDTSMALVVPAFERQLHPPCNSETDCRRHLQSNRSFLPLTFETLQDCYHHHDCTVFQYDNNREGHSSTQSEAWLERTGNNNTIATLSCLDSLRYEPYVALRWCDNQKPVAPYYDERFHGYGKNKIQYIAHLRLLGYKFGILPRGFIVHNPHVESHVKESWNDVQSHELHREMDALYRDFLKELAEKYLDSHRGDILGPCRRP